MKEFENNAYFWQKLDSLVFSSVYVKTHNVGDIHPHHPSIVYPLEYGYVVDVIGEAPIINIFKGSLSEAKCDTMIICCDILDRTIDIKLLQGCSEDEQRQCLEFLNSTSFQKTIVIRRSDEVPVWASYE